MLLKNHMCAHSPLPNLSRRKFFCCIVLNTRLPSAPRRESREKKPPITPPTARAASTRKVDDAVYFHQGARPVRKSVSVQGEKVMTSLSLTER